MLTVRSSFLRNLPWMPFQDGRKDYLTQESMEAFVRDSHTHKGMLSISESLMMVEL